MHKTILPNGLGVYQPRGMPRFSLDAYILAGHVNPDPSYSTCLEFGAGCGVISLLLAQKFQKMRFFALELFSAWAVPLGQTAIENRVGNFLPLVGDFRAPCLLGPFDLILGNPPYLNPKQGRLPEDPLRRASRFTFELDFSDLFRSARSLLAPEGLILLVLPTRLSPGVVRHATSQGFFPERRRRFFSRPESQKSWEVWSFALKWEAIGREAWPPVALYTVRGEKTPLFSALENFAGPLPDLWHYGS